MTDESLIDESTPKRPELRDPTTIALSRLYPFTIARLYIPSHECDGPVALNSLHNWRREGKIPSAVYRVRKDGRKAWFIKGTDILSLIGVEPKAKVTRAGRARPSSIESLRGEGFKNV